MIHLHPTLKDLLVREAHLRRYRGQLEPLWKKREAALRAIETTHPLFLPLVSKGKREQHEQQLGAAREAASYLRGGMEVIERVGPHLDKLIEERLEEHLGAVSPAYAGALAALRQKADWDSGLERYAGRLVGFLEAIHRLRHHAGSPMVGQLVKEMIAAAKAAADEASATNRIAAEQMHGYLEAGLNPPPLPRLPETDFAAQVQRIAVLPLPEAQAQFVVLVEQAEELRTTGIADLRAQAAATEQMQLHKIHSLRQRAREQLQAELAPEIFNGDTEHVVSETAEMFFAEAGRGGSAA